MKIDLVPLGGEPFLFLFVITALVAAFSIFPKFQVGEGGKSWAFYLPIAIVFSLVTIMSILLVFRRGVEVQDQSVTIKSVFYKIQFQKKDVDEVVVLDNSRIPSLGLRTNGIYMPGLVSGWFEGEKNLFSWIFQMSPIC